MEAGAERAEVPTEEAGMTDEVIQKVIVLETKITRLLITAILRMLCTPSDHSGALISFVILVSDILAKLSKTERMLKSFF